MRLNQIEFPSEIVGQVALSELKFGEGVYFKGLSNKEENKNGFKYKLPISFVLFNNLDKEKEENRYFMCIPEQAWYFEGLVIENIISMREGSITITIKNDLDPNFGWNVVNISLLAKFYFGAFSMDNNGNFDLPKIGGDMPFLNTNHLRPGDELYLKKDGLEVKRYVVGQRMFEARLLQVHQIYWNTCLHELSSRELFLDLGIFYHGDALDLYLDNNRNTRIVSTFEQSKLIRRPMSTPR